MINWKYRVQELTHADGRTIFCVEKKEPYNDPNNSLTLKLLFWVLSPLVYPIYLIGGYAKWRLVSKFSELRNALELIAKEQTENSKNIVVKKKTIKLWE